MQDTITKIITKTGKHGEYQNITTAGGKHMLNNKKPFPKEGDLVEYEIQETNGYTWTTSLTIVDTSEPKEDKLDLIIAALNNIASCLSELVVNTQ